MRPDYIKDAEKTEADVGASSSEAALGAELVELRDEYDKLDAALKACNAHLEAKEKQLAELMEARKLDLFRANGYTFFTQVTNHPSVNKDQLEAFIAWLDADGQGAIAKRSIHPMTLKAWVKNQLESAKALPPMVSVFNKTNVRVRRTK